jgi:DNA-directed RNA polymerase subunit H (RpoH/RPB5)
MNNVLSSFVTVKEMLTDRGINSDKLDCISDNELNIMSKTNNIFKLDVNDTLKIIYYMNAKFKINDLKKFFSENDKVLIIFKEKINNLNIKNLKDQDVKSVEIFNIRELLFNISKHILVPKHEIMKNESEIDSLMDKYQIKSKSSLPIILKTDPMARYLDMNTGDIVKITRYSPSAGEAIVYRYCV